MPLRTIPYHLGLERQRELVGRRRRGEIGDCVWYLEHPPVVTWSPARGRRHLRVPDDEFQRLGVALEKTDRGGDVTYHGPGQLVAYPIIDLAANARCGRDLHAYLRLLEEAIIGCLSRWGIAGFRVEGRTGVWVAAGANGAATSAAPRKIAAIGVKASAWVSSHGLALNTSCDLRPLRDLIAPCGIQDAGVTSICEILGERIGREEGLTRLLPVLHGCLESCLGGPLLPTFDGVAFSALDPDPSAP